MNNTIPKDLTVDNTIFKGIVRGENGENLEVLLAKDANGDICISSDNVNINTSPEEWAAFYKRMNSMGAKAPAEGFVMPSDAHNEPLPASSSTDSYINYDRSLQQKLQDAYEQSYSNKAIIDQKVNFTIGGGLDFLGASKKSTAEEQKRWKHNSEIATKLGLFEIFSEAVYQYINYGNCCVYVTKSGIIDHWKVKYCRIETKGETSLERMLIAFDKRLGFSDATRAPIYPRTAVINEGTALNGKGEIVQKSTEASVFFMKNTKGDREYWALPDHNAGILLYKTQYYISRYQEQAFIRGLMPKYMVVFYGETQKALQEKMKRFIESTNGLENSHVPIFMDALGKDTGGTNIEIIDLTRRNEGEFLELEQKTREGIYQTHRFPPSLASQEVSGKLGNAKELKDSYSLVYNTMIRPMQTDLINKLFKPIFVWLDSVYNTTFAEDFIGIKDAPPIALTDGSSLTTREDRALQGYEDSPLPDDPILNMLLDIPKDLLPFYVQLKMAEMGRAQSDTNPNPNPSTSP